MNEGIETIENSNSIYSFLVFSVILRFTKQMFNIIRSKLGRETIKGGQICDGREN